MSSFEIEPGSKGLEETDDVVGACQRPAKLAEMTQSCKAPSTSLLIASFLTLVTERDDLKDCREALMLETQYFAGVSAEVKELREKLTHYEKIDATAENTPKIRGRKPATATNNRVVALKTELAEANAAHAQLVEMFARSDSDATKARADLESCKDRLGKIKQASTYTNVDLDDARKQPV